MAAINAISGFQSAALQGLGGPNPLQKAMPGNLAGGPQALGESGKGGFGELLGQVVEAVQSRQTAATEATRAVMSGETDQVHSAMIAMQESSVAFTLMVETRNRLVESYQELMRMPV